MPKFSVKKPYTILIMVLVIIMLGVVSVTKMQMDLLPELSLPYLLVITTYPGASPEKVESTISEPMENALGTVTGVENVYSMSYENYGIVELEFADGTDMDSVMVKVNTALDSVEENLPEECGTPSIMELSMDMMATQYLAIGYDGMDMEELSNFVENDIVPELERQDGVASITEMGLIDQTVQVQLNQAKVDKLNDQILGIANDAFTDAMDELEDAKAQLEDSEAELADSKQQLADSQQELDESRQDLVDAQQELEDSKQELIDGQEELNDSQEQIADGQREIDDARSELEDSKETLEEKQEETYAQLASASEALEALTTYQAELVAQQATLKALSAAITEIKNQTNGVSKSALQEQKTQLENAKSTIDRANSDANDGNISSSSMGGAIAVLSGLDAQAGTSYADNLSAAVNAYTDADSITDPDEKAAAQASYKEAVTQILSGVSSSLGDSISQLDTGISGYDTAVQKMNSFQSEKDALEVEIEVTKAIIKGYEDQLSQMGIDYTDIEEAKMEASTQFAAAQAQIADGEQQLDDAQSQLDASQDQIVAAQEQIDSGWDQIESGQEQIDDGWDQLADGQQQIDDGWDQLADGQEQIDEGWESYYDGLVSFEKQREETLRTANADQLLSLETLSGIIYAQNFEMPAGYLDDEEDNSWLLKVGESYESLDELEDLVLCNMDDIGDIRLGDVADITIIDNSGTTYTKLNGDSAVILSVFKSSTAGTNEVSKACCQAIEELQEKYDGLSILIMMDQGDYINLIVKNVVQNMVIGAALAILILAIFLKDFMPTIVVAISIPLSVLTALVAMYFSGVSLNMMSLSGMALGIGMLVDNSIVVIENIYRLRGRGVEAPRAAVQGTKQVAGAVIASTLTTVCVFFPIVYTNGMTRELLLPMALTIIYCLMASLFIAMTVVPASASTLLRRTKPKQHKLFDKLQDAYGKALGFCLKVKIIPLAIAIGLLAFSIWQVVRMGIVMIPDMSSGELSGTVTFSSDMEREDAYEEMNTFLGRALEIEGVGSVGCFAGSSENLMISTGDSDDEYLSYSVMIKTADENAGSAEVNRITDELNEAAADLGGMELEISSGLSEMSSLLGSGLSVSIYGEDEQTLLQISEDVMDIVSGVEGFTEISNGQEEADQVLHLNINKDYAMSQGLSVAQIYQEIAGKMTTSADAVTINLNGTDMEIEVVDEMEPLTVENLMDYTFAVSDTDEDGDTVTKDIPLSDLATLETQDGVTSIDRKNQTRYMTVTAEVEDGYNTTLLTRQLEPLLEQYETPDGYSIEVGGESETVNDMVRQMILMMVMGLAFIYFVMVAQFQSLLSPFIVLFTVPLAFTGGLLALWLAGENLSVISLLGLVVLLGTVVNNGIVFVDYTNQLRMGGMERRDALIATGKTRMRPILMTAMTTILAEASMIFGDDMASQMGRGMALVIAGGLAYATLMTLFIIPIMYDILFKRKPLQVDTGSEDLDDVPDDAQEFMQEMLKEKGPASKEEEPVLKEEEPVSKEEELVLEEEEPTANEAFVSEDESVKNPSDPCVPQ